MTKTANYPSEYKVIFDSFEQENQIDPALLEVSREVALIKQLSDALRLPNNAAFNTCFDSTPTFELSFRPVRRRRA